MPPLADTGTTFVPGTALVDEAALDRIFARWAVEAGDSAFSSPVLIVAGRQDSTVGYTSTLPMLDRYPQASLAVIEGAGHALLHEHPDLVATLIHDWLDRASPGQR